MVHCFIYHIDVELKACQLELLLSTALQKKIILVLLTVSIVWIQSQGHTSEAQCSLHSVLSQVSQRNIIFFFLEHSLIIINWLIMTAKVFPHGGKEKETLANTHCKLISQS